MPFTHRLKILSLLNIRNYHNTKQMEGDSNQDGETRIRAGQTSEYSDWSDELYTVVGALLHCIRFSRWRRWMLTHLTRRNSHGRIRPKQVLISFFLAYTNFCYTSRGRWPEI